MSLRLAILCAVVVAVSAAAGFLLQRQAQQAQHSPAGGEPPGAAPARPAPPVDYAMVGRPRPAFSLPDVEGDLHHVSEWDGKVLTVNFWASWCLPCLKEIPELVALQSRFGAEGLQVVGIALQDPAEIRDFIVEKGMNYPVLAGTAPVIAVAEQYGNTAGVLPYTAIIDREGQIVFVKAGPVTGAEVEEIITPLL